MVPYVENTIQNKYDQRPNSNTAIACRYICT